MSAGLDKRTTVAIVTAAAAAAAALAVVLAVPSLAAGSPACGVYCPSEEPDPERQGKEGQAGGGGSGADSGADSGLAPRTARAADRAGRKGSALARTLGVDRGRGSDGRTAGKRGEERGFDDTSSGASVAALPAEGRRGLGLLLPLLLALTGLWAVVAGVRRRRGGPSQ